MGRKPEVVGRLIIIYQIHFEVSMPSSAVQSPEQHRYYNSIVITVVSYTQQYLNSIMLNTTVLSPQQYWYDNSICNTTASPLEQYPVLSQLQYQRQDNSNFISGYLHYTSIAQQRHRGESGGQARVWVHSARGVLPRGVIIIKKNLQR